MKGRQSSDEYVLHQGTPEVLGETSTHSCLLRHRTHECSLDRLQERPRPRFLLCPVCLLHLPSPLTFTSSSSFCCSSSTFRVSSLCPARALAEPGEVICQRQGRRAWVHIQIQAPKALTLPRSHRDVATYHQRLHLFQHQTDLPPHRHFAF